MLFLRVVDEAMKRQNPGSILSYFSKKGHVEHEETSISEDSDCDSDPDIAILSYFFVHIQF